MFALLQTPQDWQTFQGQFTAQLTQANVPISMGFQGAPQDYPCLADVFAAAGAIQCCFVYKPDAARLLLSAEMPPVPPDLRAVPTPDMPVPPPSGMQQVVKAGEPHADALAWTDQQEAMNRHVSAMLLAIVELLVDTAIIKPNAFEQRLVLAQRLVDEIVTSKKDQLQLDRPANEAVDLVLKRLGLKVENDANESL